MNIGFLGGKYLFSLAVLVGAMGVVSAFSAHAQQQAIQLLTEERFPLHYVNDANADETIDGKNVSIVREMFKRAGIGYTMDIGPWKRVYQQTLDTENTCLFTTLVTEDRKKIFTFISPLSQFDWSFMASADSDIQINNLDQVRRYVVGVYDNDVRHKFLEKQGGFNLSVVGADMRNVSMLQAGRIDLWLTSKFIARRWAKQVGFPMKSVYTYRIFDGGLACNKQTPEEYTIRLQAALESMDRDGTREALFDQPHAALQPNS